MPPLCYSMVSSQPLDLTIGGISDRLLLSHKSWEELRVDPWILSVVKEGYSLEWEFGPPPLSHHPIWLPSCAEKDQVKLEMVRELLEIGAIEEVKNQNSPGCYNVFFLVPKENGTWRGILDLKCVNLYVKKQKFKMETPESIRAMMETASWAVSLDLTHAYYHVLVHPSHKKYLRFTIANKVFQFRALPMGLRSSPRVFTQLTLPIKQWAHQQGIHLHQYLDDWIIRSTDRKTLVAQSQAVVRLTRSLGFVLNQKKSVLVPTQKIKHLGMEYDLSVKLVGLTVERRERLLNKIAKVERETPNARDWEKMISTFISMKDLLPIGRALTRQFQWYLRSQWDQFTTFKENSHFSSSRKIRSVSRARRIPSGPFSFSYHSSRV